VNALFQRYEPASEQLHDEWEEEVEEVEVLDDIGIWKVVGAWLSGTLNFELLMGQLDSQRKTYTNIGYWEDLVSKLAFESDLDKREAIFKEISLAEHHRRLVNYSSDAVPLPKSPSPTLRSPSRPSSPSNAVQRMSVWSVKIVPGESYVQTLRYVN
jgi:hypothetical protein